MSYRPKTCSVSLQEIMDYLEETELIELELGETLISVKIKGDEVVFTFDVKEE